MRINEIHHTDKIKKIQQCYDWALRRLGIRGTPKLRLSNDQDRVESHRTFGSTTSSGDIWVHVGNRNSADVMRTLIHELAHFKQFEDGYASDDMDEQTRQQIEDEANAIAGRLMREYGQQHVDIYENKNWRLKRSAISEQNFAIAYQKRWEREKKEGSTEKFKPSPLLAYSLYHRVLKESKNLHLLKDFQKYLITLDQRKQINLQIGTMLSILQFVPHTASNVIEVRGNRGPKKVTDIFYDDAGDVDWISFSDGSTFPDKEFLERGQGGGDWEGLSTLFFKDQISLEKALMLAVLNQPGNWHLSTANLNESYDNNQSKSEIQEAKATGRTGTIQHEVADSLPQAFVIPGLNSSNPYEQYKFGTAIAAARGQKARDLDGIAPFVNHDLRRDWADKEVVISFDPHIDKIIDAALKDAGIKGGKRRIGIKGSYEQDSVDKISPIKPFTGY